MQGSYTRGIDPNYASKVSIPVPKIADDGKRTRSKSQKWKLRTKVGLTEVWGKWPKVSCSCRPLKDLGSWEVPLSEGDKSSVLLPTFQSLLHNWCHRLLDEWDSLGVLPVVYVSGIKVI